MGGTNDLYFGADATTTYNSIVSYLQGRKTAGFEVIVTTILPRSGGATPLSFEADRQTVNSLIRANWSTFADGISDVALDSRIGDEGDELDTTYYASDKVHMANTGYGIVASYATAAIKQIIDPIAVSNISVTPSTTTATVTWTTNQTGSTQVDYGLTDSYGSSTAEADTDTRVLSHSDTLSNLVANTTYHFQTASNDLNSNQVLSTDQSFTTLADTPTNIVSTSQSAIQIGVSVDIFTNYSVGSSGYYFENITNGSNSGWIQTNSWQNAGLACDHTYSYSVKYRNGDGTETSSISTAVSTSGCESGFLSYLYNSSSTTTVESDTVDSDSDSVSQEINLRTAPIFEDISDHWAEDFVEDLYERGVVSGYDEFHFGPENNISRAELTKIAIEAFGISLSDEGGGRFPDVPENEWYAPYVQTAYLRNIIEGYADGTFGPNENVTRAEALRILFDAAGVDVKTDYAAGFPDVSAGAWYASYVNYAAENGIVSGYSDGTFGPNEKLTRAQVSKIVSLMIGLYID
ncbi:MAG: hypothetical protein GWP15_02565 [Nitrospirae bacterium]|nr:hypothetical protein [Nitrospirota bacterium]